MPAILGASRRRISRAGFKITDYGAHPDAGTDNTEAIRKAIDACTIPAVDASSCRQVFFKRPIHLKSNVRPHRCRSATLKFSADRRSIARCLHALRGKELFEYYSLRSSTR